MSPSKLKRWGYYCINCTMVFIEFILMDTIHLYFIRVLISDIIFTFRSKKPIQQSWRSI